MSEKRLDGKVALVTGASRGLGRAVALELAGLGADMVLTARSDVGRQHLPGTIGDTATAVEQLGRKALPVRADLLVPSDVERLVGETLQTYGRVDILVNNAANTEEALFESFWETSPESWEQQVQLNLNVPYRLMKSFAPSMKDNGGGLIINIGGANTVPPEGTESMAWQGLTVATSYQSTKLALLSMSILLAKELADSRIAVVTISPGTTATEVFNWHQERFRVDLGGGSPAALPARAVGYVAASDDPMSFSGTFIDAVPFLRELGLEPA
jgi:NAD(P)-dependent dehydrogenase (short-subunit alcohol dehydrogenase family)